MSSVDEASASGRDPTGRRRQSAPTRTCGSVRQRGRPRSLQFVECQNQSDCQGMGVLVEPFGLGGRGDGHGLVLDQPSQLHGRRCGVVFLSYALTSIVELAQRALRGPADGQHALERGHLDSLLAHPGDVAVGALEVRVVLDLVDRGRVDGRLEGSLEIGAQVVADANRPGFALLIQLLLSGPYVLQVGIGVSKKGAWMR